MAKSLNDILKVAHDRIRGVHSSTTSDLSTGKDPGVDYAPPASNDRDFIAKHSVQKWDEPEGNPNYTDKVKDAPYHKQSKSVYESKKAEDTKCNKTPGQTWCPLHEMADCSKSTTIKEKDEGKPGLNFKKIANKAAKEYGSKEAGNRVAGAIRAKILAKEESIKEAYDDNSTKVSDWSDKKLKWHASDDRKHSSSHVPAWSELRRRAKTSAPAQKSMKEATDPRDSLPQTYRPNDTTPYSRDRLATRMPSNPKDSKPKKAGRLLGLKSSIKDALGKHGPKGKLPEETIDEVLTKSTTAGETISDFVHSKNSKFAGKSKEKRKQMALAAYYAKQNEEAVNEISDKLALSYAKGASKSMDAAAAKGSAGHETFMKRSAGHALALDKTNPEHKRLKAKVGTSDANAKDAAYKKAIGEAILPGTFVEPSDSAKSKAKQIQQKDADNAVLSRAKMGITEKMDDTQKAAVRAAQNWRQKTGTAKPSISDTKRTIGFIKKNSVAKEETDPGFKEGHVPDHQPKLAPKDASTMSKVAAMMAKERESFRQRQAGNTAKLVAANKSGKDS